MFKQKMSFMCRWLATERKFTMIELLVVVSILMVLSSLLLPALARARNTVKNAVCQNNLKQLGVAVSCYTIDSADSLPWGYNSYRVFTIFRCMLPYVGGGDNVAMAANKANPFRIPTYHCPRGSLKHIYSSAIDTMAIEAMYGYNVQIGFGKRVGVLEKAKKITAIKMPSSAFAMGDGRLNIDTHMSQSWGYNGDLTTIYTEGRDEFVQTRHGRGVEILFFDGHVSLILPLDYPLVNTSDKSKAFWLGDPARVCWDW